jgi:diguanylate cyclase (GGDEF)-like protein
MLFNDRLKQVLAQAARHGRGVAVMFIDLDGFKLVNDSFGHDVGDTVLRRVAQRLQASMRAEDTVSRHGGDEFLCIMMEANDERDIAKVAGKMITVIATPTEVGDVKLIVKPSIGIAVYPKDGETAKELIAKADTAMYRAKRTCTGYLSSSMLARNDAKMSQRARRRGAPTPAARRPPRSRSARARAGGPPPARPSPWAGRPSRTHGAPPLFSL